MSLLYTVSFSAAAGRCFKLYTICPATNSKQTAGELSEALNSYKASKDMSPKIQLRGEGILDRSGWK